jgi:hypothetical protein
LVVERYGGEEKSDVIGIVAAVVVVALIQIVVL